jgi:predicted membrane protein
MTRVDRKRVSMAVLLLLGSVLIAGCAVKIGDFEFQIGDPEMFEVGELQREDRTVSLDDVDTVQVDVGMGAGEIFLSGGSEALMEAEFVYNVAEWQPEISYNREDGQGTLVIRQPLKGTIQAKNVRNEWILQLNETVPMRMLIRLGAGKGDIDLRGFKLQDLDVELGAGEVSIDLSGAWDESFNVSLKRGVGTATLRLPKDVGVRVNITSGLGTVIGLGLIHQGEYYMNEAYGESDVTIEVEILGAIGTIDLEVIE